MAFTHWTLTDWSIWLTLVFTFATVATIAVYFVLQSGKKQIEVAELKDANQELELDNLKLQQYIKVRDDQAWKPEPTEQVAPVEEGKDGGDTMIIQMPITHIPPDQLEERVRIELRNYRGGKHRFM